MIPLTQVLAGLEAVARPIMLEKVRPDSCIAMTRVAVEVLDHFGYAAAPLNVEAVIINREFKRRLDDGVIFWGTPLTADDIASGAYSLGLGMESQRLEKVAKGEEAGGHVVAAVDKYLLDLSIDQAARPDHGINLTPKAFEFDGDVAAGDQWTYRINDGEAFVVIELHPELATWKDSPDWTQGLKRYRAEIGRIIRAIRAGPQT